MIEEISSKNIQTKRKRTQNKPQWMTKQVEKEIKLKRKLWKKVHRCQRYTITEHIFGQRKRGKESG